MKAVRGESSSNYPTSALDLEQSRRSYGGLPQGDNSSNSNSVASSAYQLQPHPHQPAYSAVNHQLSGVFGESQWFDTITMENASPSPPPLEPWPNCSIFMVATEPWPSGTSSRSATTGEQLNTPQPANGDIGGFDFESVFGGDSGRQETSQRAANVNLTNVFSKHDINGITKNAGEDVNNNSGNNGKGNDSSSLQHSGSIEPIFFNHQESVITAGFDSWEFEPCLEETLLSPISYVATPHHSAGVASPGSSSGDTDSPNHRRSLQESETCVDFNSFLFSPSSPIVEASEEDDLCAGNLHEEIEQLSNSFYCTSNSLVSVQSAALTAGIDNVSPSLLQLLQEEDQQPLRAASLQQQRQPSVAANSYFSDATNDGEDEQQQQHVERKQKVEVVDDDETLDVKTQTQLEHNYTIQLPSGSSEGTNPAATFKKQTNTVKEANLALQAKARETLKPQPATVVLQQQHQQRRPPIYQQQSVKRQLFQRMKSRMAAAASTDPVVRKVPNLKLKIVNASEARVVDDSATMALTTTQVVINTPDLTENLLDLEDEFLIKEDNFDLLNYIDSATGYDVIHSPKEEKPVINFTEPAPAPITTSTDSATTTVCGPTLSDLFNPAKRKLPAITIESLDELTSSTNSKRVRSSATSSTASSVCGDNASEASAATGKPAKRRGRPPKPVSSVRDRSEYEHLNEADMRYREQRDKNNEASRKSRINRKDRESKLEEESAELIQKYEVLEGKERELIRECARWRKAVMRLALL